MNKHNGRVINSGKEFDKKWKADESPSCFTILKSINPATGKDKILTVESGADVGELVMRDMPNDDIKGDLGILMMENDRRSDSK